MYVLACLSSFHFHTCILQPAPDTMIEPLSEFVNPLNPTLYNSFTWRTFRESRFAGDYADEGKDEIQISAFRKK